MANFAAQWGAAANEMVARPLLSVDGLAANGVPYEAMGRVVQGLEPWLGSGEFMYCMAGANITLGQVVEFDNAVDPNYSTGLIMPIVNPWAGTANSGKPLGVAVAAMAQYQFGWVQMAGNAVVATSGTITVGNSGYWVTGAKLQGSGAVASKQALNVVAATAAAATIGTGSNALALAANFAIYAINWPVAQGAIT